MRTPEGHQKCKFSTSKVKKAKSSYEVYLKEIAGSIETPNQPIETKHFLKKVCLVPWSIFK
jgi:hypothetical protein